MTGHAGRAKQKRIRDAAYERRRDIRRTREKLAEYEYLATLLELSQEYSRLAASTRARLARLEQYSR